MSGGIGPISRNDFQKLRYPPHYDEDEERECHEWDCNPVQNEYDCLQADEEEPEFLDEDSYPEEDDE